MDIRDTALFVDELIENDKDRDDLYAQIDDAVNCVFNPSSGLVELPWIKNRHYALTDIADARNAGVRTFSVMLPSVEVSPNSDMEYEYERTERMEEVLKWEFARMNRVDYDSVHTRIVESAINYHMVALQTQYLPYFYKGREKTPKIKAQLRQKCFNWVVHNPATVHTLRASDGSLDGVAKVAQYTLQQLEDEFGDNPAINKLKRANERSNNNLDTEFTLVDWTDWERRQIWVMPGDVSRVASVSAGNTVDGGNVDYVIMDEEHGLPFIPWVIVDKKNPLWQSVISSGMWDNAQHMNIIRFAKAIEQAAFPNLVITTPDGTLKGVWIDPTNPSNFLQIPPGASVNPLSRPQIDPGLEQHFGEMRAAIQRSTVSQVLTDIGQYSNAPFSTVNQIVQMALGQLAPAKNCAEEAEARAFYQMFEWIEHSKIPLVSYRQKDKDSATGTKRRGEQMGIFPGAAPELDPEATPEQLTEQRKRIYFDLDALYISVSMKSQNTADEQARQNVVINSVTHLGASKEWSWEQMGYNNFQLIQDQRAAEMLADAELNKATQLMMLEVQAAQMKMQMEAQQAQAQQAQQQQPQPQNETAALNGENAMSTMQGQDMRGGMNPAQAAAPGLGREQITGQTVNTA